MSNLYEDISKRFTIILFHIFGRIPFSEEYKEFLIDEWEIFTEKEYKQLFY